MKVVYNKTGNKKNKLAYFLLFETKKIKIPQFTISSFQQSFKNDKEFEELVEKEIEKGFIVQSFTDSLYLAIPSFNHKLMTERRICDSISRSYLITGITLFNVMNKIGMFFQSNHVNAEEPPKYYSDLKNDDEMIVDLLRLFYLSHNFIDFYGKIYTDFGKYFFLSSRSLYYSLAVREIYIKHKILKDEIALRQY